MLHLCLLKPKIMLKTHITNLYLEERLRKSCISENILTTSELTWIVDELRKNGSTITRKVLTDVIYNAHFAPKHFADEVQYLTDYIKSKRMLIRKLKSNAHLICIANRNR